MQQWQWRRHVTSPNEKSPKLKTGRESLLQAKSPLKVSGIEFIAPDRVLG